MRRRILLGVAAAAASSLIASCAGNIGVDRGRLHENTNDAIVEMTQVNFQGYEQYLQIRGADADAPVLLFLHGGPGFSELPLLNQWNAELENHFVVVQWEQPGAGRSYRREYQPGFIDGETLVDIGLDITDYLKARFGREQIYLVGHCMGTIIGVEMIRRRPEDFAAYVGVTQHVNLRSNLAASYDRLLDWSESNGNERATAELEGIASIFSGESNMNFFSAEAQGQAGTYAKWLERSGGFYYGEDRLPRAYRRAYLHSEDYRLRDVLNAPKGPALMRPVAEGWIDLDYATECPSLEVPVWFVMGANDRHVMQNLTQAWFDILDAPSKTFLAFENSAHFPLFEEADRFNQLMLQVLQQTE